MVSLKASLSKWKCQVGGGGNEAGVQGQGQVEVSILEIKGTQITLKVPGNE